MLQHKIIIKMILIFPVLVLFPWEIKICLLLALSGVLVSNLRSGGPLLPFHLRERGLLDFPSLFLIVLTAWLSTLIVVIRVKVFKSGAFFNLLIVLFLSLALRFRVTSLFLFYLFFEWSLLPIFLIILGWGYQPERLRASLLLFFYTLFASLPLLLVLLYWSQTAFITRFKDIILILTQRTTRFVTLRFITILAFVVKFPIYFVHLWLPKAHVEAPVAGSIILAGVLLKLGGYGIIRLSAFFLHNPLIFSVGILTMWGGGVLGALCLRIRDIKVIIAYSSVVHIRLVFIGVISYFSWGLNGAIVIMVAHGLCSSGMFAWANMVYERRHSRRLTLNKGLLTISPSFRFWWFLLIVRNFAGPFTLNLAGEIFLIINTMVCRNLFWVRIAFISFFSAGYSLLLYSSTQQGRAVAGNILGLERISLEQQVIFAHVWPVYLITISTVFS